MSVLLRCPNCGTTRGERGECEVCHEAQVRYFCTNHRPGLWLDAGRCPECGAKAGDSLRAPTIPIPARPAPSRAPVRPVRPVRPARPAPSEVPAPPARERPPTPIPSAASIVATPSSDATFSEAPPWQRLLAGALRARAAATAERGAARLIVDARGCVTRFITIALVLLLAFGAAAFLFGRALLRGLHP